MTKKDIVVMPKVMYTLKKSVFFNHYFKSTSKEAVAAFLSPYLMSLATKDVNFSIYDLLQDVKTVPAYILEDYPDNLKTNVDIPVSSINLI